MRIIDDASTLLSVEHSYIGEQYEDTDGRGCKWYWGAEFQ